MRADYPIIMQVDRRREIRKVTAARGLLETARLRRLRNLSEVIKTWKQLDVQAKETATSTLKDYVHGLKPIPSAPDYIEGILGSQGAADVGQQPGYASENHTEIYGEFSGEELSQLLKRAGVPVSASGELDADISNVSTGPSVPPSPRLSQLPRQEAPADLSALAQLSMDDATSEDLSDLADETQLSLPTVSQDTMAGTGVEDVSSSLAKLYAEYVASMERFDSLPQAILTPHTVSDDASALEAKTEYMMSKTQCQLTLEEGSVWSQLASPGAPSEDVEHTAVSLTQKSTILFDSYSLRTNPPTSQTYEESKEIIRAMGVPCIEPDGPFEAEALAASMVLHGQADYVASEDTVEFPRAAQ